MSRIVRPVRRPVGAGASDKLCNEAQSATARRHIPWRQAVQLMIAIGLLAVLWQLADWRLVAGHLLALSLAPLAAALALFIPQTLISALRWRAWCRPLATISTAEAVRQILATSALNLVLPSKTGDLTKAGMLPGLDGSGRRRAGALALAEKLADVTVLAGWLLLGQIGLASGELALVTAATVGWVAARWAPARLATIARLIAATVLLWALHLVQIHLFLLAADVPVDATQTLARVPVAIFVGLLPVSFCGVGTRDAALVWLYADVASAATMTAVGLLVTLRYLVPGAAGIAVVGHYLPSWRRNRSTPAPASGPHFLEKVAG